MLAKAGCSGQDEQVGGTRGGNNPVSPEVTVVQQTIRKEETRETEAADLGNEKAAESTRQEKGHQRKEEAAPARC